MLCVGRDRGICIDLEGPAPDDCVDGDSIVEIPNILNPIAMGMDHYQEMCATIDPLRPSDSYGIDIFVETVSFIAAHSVS